jgi:photosynthetic reaction center cytochrome c subunit
MKFVSKRMIVVVSLTAVVAVSGAVFVRGQAAPRTEAQTPQGQQMSDQYFKNIPNLKGIPVDEFMDTMGMIAAALSMNCTDCHTEDSTAVWANFAKDTPMKVKARQMIAMVNNINRTNFKGVKMVTCWTCHRGDRTPKAEPSLAIQYGLPFEDPNDPLFPVRPAAGTPTADQVFDKYIQAIGGAQRVSALNSFTAKGTYVGYETDQATVPIEIFAKAPNQRTTIVRALWGDSYRTYDGRAGWISSADRPVPLFSLTSGNLEGARIEAIMSFPAQVKDAFAPWRVATALIDDRDVQVLQGRTSPGQPTVNLYFDPTSGLLVRVVRHSVTAIGTVPTQIDYSDYRDVGGIKMPFKWVVTWTDGETTTQLSEVKPNVPVEAAIFNQPAPAKEK